MPHHSQDKNNFGLNTFDVFSQFFEHNVCDKSDIPLDLKDKLHVRFSLITSQKVFRHYA